MDDFYEDDFEDTFCDPSDDRAEDMAEDLCDDHDSLIDEPLTEESESNHDGFDLGDAILFGTVAGMAYDDAVDEHRRKKLINKKDD